MKLNQWVKAQFQIDSEIDYHWSGQIIEPVDGLAYIGVNPGRDNNVFIAAGDSGHGITHGTIAGILLTDLICERENPWAQLYSPNRLSFKGLGNYVSQNLNSFWQYKDWISGTEKKGADYLQRSQGAVVRDGISATAHYRDSDGKLHQFSATCPHLGGLVRWNEVEKTFDCPCHGSRFSCLGEVINGPACQNLSPKDQIAHPDLLMNRDAPESILTF